MGIARLGVLRGWMDRAEGHKPESRQDKSSPPCTIPIAFHVVIFATHSDEKWPTCRARSRSLSPPFQETEYTICVQTDNKRHVEQCVQAAPPYCVCVLIPYTYPPLSHEATPHRLFQPKTISFSPCALPFPPLPPSPSLWERI